MRNNEEEKFRFSNSSLQSRTEILINTNPDEQSKSRRRRQFSQEEIKIEPQKNFLIRTFSKIEPGSMRGSIFNLVILAIGIGSLSLPQQVSNLGVLLWLILMIITAILTNWTIGVLIKAARERNLTNYSQTVEEYLGKKWSILYDINMIIYIFGMLVSYQIIGYQMIGAIIYNSFSSQRNSYINLEEFYKNSFWNDILTRLLVMIGCATVILIPLNSLRKISKLRFTSLFGIISLAIFACVLCVQLPFFIIQNNKKGVYDNINIYNFKKSFEGDIVFFKSWASIIFAYTCHHGVFPVYHQLFDNNERRTNKVIFRAIVIDFIYFMIIGLIGYFTQPFNTPYLIITRNQLEEDSLDIMMIISRGFILLMIFCKIPINFNALRLSFSYLVWNETELSTFKNLIIVIPFTIISACVGALYNNIGNYLSFLGGVCSVIFSFILPSFIFLSSNKGNKISILNIIFLVLCGIISLVGFTSGGFTLKSIIMENRDKSN